MRAFHIAIVLMLAAVAGHIPALAQQPQKGWIGIKVVTVTPALMAEKKFAVPSGVFVTEIAQGSPAANDLKIGDVILFLNGQPVQTAEGFLSAIEALAPRTKAQLSAIRERQFLSLEITVARPPASVIAGRASRAVGDPLLRLDTGGHQAIIRALTFTPDGKFIVAAGFDKLINVWDWRTGRVVRTLRGLAGVGNEGKFYAIALSPDGRWLAAGGFLGSYTGNKPKEEEEAHQVRLYDFASGELKALLKGHANVVNAVAFSPDGRHLITGSSDFDAIVWDVKEAKLLHRLKGHRAQVYAVGFTADGTRVVTGSQDKTLRLWNVADGALLNEMPGHGDGIFALAVSKGDGSIASGDSSGEIRLWDGTTGAFLKVLVPPGGNVGSLSFSPDGRALLSACGRKACAYRQQIFDAASGKELSIYTKHDNIVVASAFSPDGRLVATGGGDNKEIHIWDPNTAETKKVLKGTGTAIWAAAFSVDGKSIAWGNTWTGNDTRAGYGPLEMALLLPSADETLATPLPVTSEEGWQRAISSLGGYSLQHRQGGHFGYDVFLDILKDGKVLASIERGTRDGYGHRSYSFTPDGKSVISGGDGGHLTAYDLDGKKIGEFIGHESEVWAVVPSPDGRYLVSGSADQTVRLWNLQTRELILTLFRGSDGEWVLYTPQGYFAASEGGGKLVTWQVNKGPERAACAVSGDQLYQSLYRPALIARAIALASAEEAIKQSKDEAGFKLAEFLQDCAPAIRLINRRNEEDKDRTTLTLAFEPNTLAVTGVDFFVNGNKVGVREVKPANPLSKEGFLLRAFTIPLAHMQNEIKIVAHNKVGDSETLTHYVYH